jgi:penicillin-binding protein 1B
VQQLNHALVQAVERGTGRPARSTLPRDLTVAGKTGTSDELRDSWFAGFTNDHLAVVWIGRDDNMPVGLTGSSGALSIWAALIAGLQQRESFNPALSPSLNLVWLDYETGLGTHDGCGESVLVPVPAGSEPGRLSGCGQGLRELGARVRRWFQGDGNQ